MKPSICSLTRQDLIGQKAKEKRNFELLRFGSGFIANGFSLLQK